MRFLFLALLLVAGGDVLSQSQNTNRVPPFGIAVAAEDRQALTEKLTAFEGELKQLQKHAPAAAWLPEVQIFHKAVSWALTYEEFYRSNEIAAAHKLIEQGMERARALSDGANALRLDRLEPLLRKLSRIDAAARGQAEAR